MPPARVSSHASPSVLLLFVPKLLIISTISIYRAGPHTFSAAKEFSHSTVPPPFRISSIRYPNLTGRYLSTSSLDHHRAFLKYPLTSHFSKVEMSDAFNNYCITCDQLCLPYAVYCSAQCKEKDEHQLANLFQSCNQTIVSPLLTPSICQPQSMSPELGDSPLLLPSGTSNTDVQEFSLNYSVSQAPPRVQATSTLQNYRLWLTGVM